MKTQTAWRRIALRIGGVISVSILAAAGAGCSGINASKSISPLDFLLPGLMQNTPEPRPAATNAPCELAQVVGTVQSW